MIWGPFGRNLHEDLLGVHGQGRAMRDGTDWRWVIQGREENSTIHDEMRHAPFLRRVVEPRMGGRRTTRTAKASPSRRLQPREQPHDEPEQRRRRSRS